MAVDWRTRLQKALARRSEQEDTAEGPASGASGVPAPTTTTDAAPGQAMVTRMIAIADILANPYQPRVDIDDESLASLAESIRRHGLLQPILVRMTSSGTYELVAGQRRLRAMDLLGATHVPSVVLNATPDESGLLALVENIQREDLSFMEEAAAYERLLRDFALTQEELAARIGKGQSTVANKLRLLRLPASVRERINAPAFTERHARALLGLADESAQLAVASAVETQDLTVRQTEDLVKQMSEAANPALEAQPRKPGPNWRGVFRDVRILSNTFRTAVEQLRAAGLEAEVAETEQEDGLEIRVFVRLPQGWRRHSRRRVPGSEQPSK